MSDEIADSVSSMSLDSFGVIRFEWRRANAEPCTVEIAPPDMDDPKSRSVVIWHGGIFPTVSMWSEHDSSPKGAVIRYVLAGTRGGRAGRI